MRSENPYKHVQKGQKEETCFLWGCSYIRLAKMSMPRTLPKGKEDGGRTEGVEGRVGDGSIADQLAICYGKASS